MEPRGLRTDGNENKVSSMEQIYENGMRIQESEIVKRILPDMKSSCILA
jgi:small subunit ribosomal protein S5